MSDQQNLSSKIEKEEIISRPEVTERIERKTPARKVELGPESLEILPEVGQEKESKGGAEKVGEPGSLAGLSQAQKRKKIQEKEIESVLAKDLEDIYVDLPPDKQEEFKRVGEETTKKINILLESARVNVKKIVDLIKRWLLIIPGVNKFFLEKEAKIKADEIMKIKNHEINKY